MLQSGVPMLRSLDTAKQIMGNVILQRAIDDAKKAVTEGESLAQTLKKSGQFPATMIHMVSVGEKAGQLEQMLERVATTYEAEVDTKLGRFTALLEPLMLVFMGGAVAFIVFSILRQALGLQQTPSNQILTGMALFLTLFIMAPVFDSAWQQGVKPYMSEEIAFEEAMDKTSAPFHEFMAGQTRESDLALFAELGGYVFERVGRKRGHDQRHPGARRGPGGGQVAVPVLRADADDPDRRHEHRRRELQTEQVDGEVALRGAD